MLIADLATHRLLASALEHPKIKAIDVAVYTETSLLHHISSGISLGWLFQSWVPLDRRFRFYLMTSFSLGLSATAIYWTLITLGIDLNW